jgi:restriction endonuclease S subunit
LIIVLYYYERKQQLKNLVFYFPDIKDQKQIVEYIDSLDAQIREFRSFIKNLDIEAKNILNNSLDKILRII